MKKKSMNLITAVAVLVVLSGAYVGVKTYVAKQEEKENAEEEEEKTQVFSISSEDVQSIKFVIDKKEVTFEKNNDERTIRKQLEVDFVCNQASKRYYIQSAFAIPNKEKMEQEQKSLINIDDSFKKIIIVKEDINLWRNEEGILIIGLEEFLLNPNSLDL